MSHPQRSTNLLRRVVLRLQLKSFSRRLYLFLLVCSGLFAAGLLATRLSGAIPDWFELWTVALVPGCALLLALALASPAESG